jgi:hypothetical protein
MSTRRMVEITCELCGYQEDWPNLPQAWQCGWKRDRWPTGQRVDLCSDCATKVGVEADD